MASENTTANLNNPSNSYTKPKTSAQNGNVIEIDLIDLAKFLFSKALVIVLAAMLGALISFLYSYVFISPKYESTALMYANNSNITLGATSISISQGNMTTASSLAGAYQRILVSRTTLEEVASEANVHYSYEQLYKMVSTVSYDDANGMFSVTVSSKSPTEAERIANTIANVLPGRIEEIIDGSSVKIVDYAIVPSHRSSPSYTKNSFMGFIIGAVLACGVYFVIYMMGNMGAKIIYTEKDVAELFPNVPILGSIPNLKNSDGVDYYSSYYGYGNEYGYGYGYGNNAKSHKSDAEKK